MFPLYRSGNQDARKSISKQLTELRFELKLSNTKANGLKYFTSSTLEILYSAHPKSGGTETLCYILLRLSTLLVCSLKGSSNSCQEGIVLKGNFPGIYCTAKRPPVSYLSSPFIVTLESLPPPWRPVPVGHFWGTTRSFGHGQGHGIGFLPGPDLW